MTKKHDHLRASSKRKTALNSIAITQADLASYHRSCLPSVLLNSNQLALSVDHLWNMTQAWNRLLICWKENLLTLTPQSIPSSFLWNLSDHWSLVEKGQLQCCPTIPATPSNNYGKLVAPCSVQWNGQLPFSSSFPHPTGTTTSHDNMLTAYYIIT